MNPASLSVGQRVNALVKALNGAKRTNEALARCRNGEEMLDVLLDASAKLGLGLTRQQLADTPPIRDWVWWKNKEALLTIGDNKPRYQQDGGQGKVGSRNTDRANADRANTDRNNRDGAPTDAPQPRKRFLGLF